jgi:glucosamine kinase
MAGTVLGEGLAGPANLRLGLEESFSAVHQCAGQCLRYAGLAGHEGDVIACLALAGASEPDYLASAREHPHPFRRAVFTTDARAACIGAHGGRDGGIIIVGTGSIGWAKLGPRELRVGGWGFPISDDGSGAWIGCKALRRTLRAHDGLIDWTGSLQAVFERFARDPHAIVRWMGTARPRDYGSLAPIIVEAAARGEGLARGLMRRAAGHLDALAARLLELEVPRLALMGGLANAMEQSLSAHVRGRLTSPMGDALSGAVYLARAEAERLAPDVSGSTRTAWHG